MERALAMRWANPRWQLRSVAQRWAFWRCCRRCDEVCAGNSSVVRSKAAQEKRGEPAPRVGPAPRLGVSTSIPPGLRKGTQARLTHLGQLRRGSADLRGTAQGLLTGPREPIRLV
jgi:hypothetical protein